VLLTAIYTLVYTVVSLLEQSLAEVVNQQSADNQSINTPTLPTTPR